MGNETIYCLFTIENNIIIHVISDVGQQNRLKVLSDTANLHSTMHRCDVQLRENSWLLPGTTSITLGDQESPLKPIYVLSEIHHHAKVILSPSVFGLHV